jgi:hypothetical protein
MAIFRVPRITTASRLSLTLEESEIVYDVDLDLFFGGNGIDKGGFPIGRGVDNKSYTITLSGSDIQNKKIILDPAPIYPTNVSLTPYGGIPQANGIDFEVIGNELKWNGLGLDNFLEAGEKLIVQY